MNGNTKEFMLRLDRFAKFNGTSVLGLQKALGKSNSYFRNTYSQSGRINKTVWDELREKIDPCLNEVWLETGEGEFRKTNTTATVDAVPLYPSTQSITLDSFLSNINSMPCERIIAPLANIQLAITINDDYTNSLPRGCKAYLRKVDDSRMIEYGKIYAIDTNHGIIVRTIFPSNITEGALICHSTMGGVPDITILKEEILGIYKVVAETTIF